MEELESVLGKKVVFRLFEGEKMVNSCLFKTNENVEIILDNSHISFKDCISILESLKNQGFTFKIIPKSSNFLIGSNNNNERGTIIEIR